MYRSPVPEERQVTAAMCAVLAERIDVAVQRFEQFGLRVPDTGRLRKERRLLQAIADEGEYPSSRSLLALIGNAIQDAMDFHQISRLLPAGRSDELASDLDRALRGTVEQGEPTRKPYQFQSQLWLGAMLEYAGLDPEVPRFTGRRSPDFLINCTTSVYGVEVKRPERQTSIVKNLDSAVAQLSAAEKYGTVAIDLSDCLGASVLRRITDVAGDAPYDAAHVDFLRMRDDLQARVFDQQRRQYQPGYGRVMVLLIFARGLRWDLANPKAPYPFTMTEVGAFTSAHGSLRHHHAVRIRDSLIEGLRTAGLYVSDQSTTVI